MLNRLSLHLFFFFTFFSINEGFCVENIDFNGTTMVSKFGVRITDDSIAQEIEGPKTTVSWLCNKLKNQKYKNVESLNLSKNYILDGGAEKLADFFSEGHLPHLKVLDLSFNRISEEGMLCFIPLLERNSFEHLIIYGNNGAATIEGITSLASSLMQDLKINSREGIREYLAKVIWVPKNWLDAVKKRGDIPEYYANAHYEFYELPY